MQPPKSKAFGQLLWLLPLLLTILCGQFHSSTQTSSPRVEGGFRVDLIHWDSPLSPYYNSSATAAKRLHLAASLRNRSPLPKHIQHGGLVTGLREAGGQYLIGINFGTPQRKLFILADTGSDLIWIQCHPCAHCEHQDVPLFKPKESRTYVPYPCYGKLCGEDLALHGCFTGSNQCGYFYTYEDQSMSFGFLAQETISFTSTATGQIRIYPNINFGCDIFDAGLFSSLGVGVAGLGPGPLSLISQLGARISYRFSHCLVASGTNQTGSISFGEDPLAARDRRAISTLLTVRDHYYVTLESVSIEGKTFKVSKTNGRDTGNMVVDSGTTLTYINEDACKGLERVLEEILRAKRLRRYKDKSGTYRVCFLVEDLSKLELPGLVFRFKGRAEVHVPPQNVFISPDDQDSQVTVLCFTVLPASFGFQIYGMISMTDFEVEYDLKKKLVTLAPTTCAGKKK